MIRTTVTITVDVGHADTMTMTIITILVHADTAGLTHPITTIITHDDTDAAVLGTMIPKMMIPGTTMADACADPSQKPQQRILLNSVHHLCHILLPRSGVYWWHHQPERVSSRRNTPMEHALLNVRSKVLFVLLDSVMKQKTQTVQVGSKTQRNRNVGAATKKNQGVCTSVRTPRPDYSDDGPAVPHPYAPHPPQSPVPPTIIRLGDKVDHPPQLVSHCPDPAGIMQVN